MNSKPVLLSGIKPTGDLHIGNYFGAMRQQVDLFKSGEYQCYIMVADYHALNTIQDATEMKKRTLELTAAYIAVGLDPEKVILFKQSDVPAHTELTWIFDAITTMPYLMRAHAFKDAEAKNHEITVGTFNYPMLMAADILLYDTAIVPVGQDQKQHIEYARDTAEKFNRTFGETFTLPKDHIMPDVATVPGTDGQKMSKSYGNVIPLFAPREVIVEKVMSIVTDSSGERPENVYAIHKLLKSDDELAPLYEEHKGKYKDLKEALIEDLETFIAPMREKYDELMKDTSAVLKVLEAGKEKAREVSEAKMQQVRAAIGVS
jgi:tryptophanyl-tRNA synthetase